MVSLAGRERRPARSGSKPSKKEEAWGHWSWEVFLRRTRSGLEQETPARLRAVKPVLLDTGVIVALLDRSERFHHLPGRPRASSPPFSPPPRSFPQPTTFTV